MRCLLFLYNRMITGKYFSAQKMLENLKFPPILDSPGLERGKSQSKFIMLFCLKVNIISARMVYFFIALTIRAWPYHHSNSLT